MKSWDSRWWTVRPVLSGFTHCNCAFGIDVRSGRQNELHLWERERQMWLNATCKVSHALFYLHNTYLFVYLERNIFISQNVFTNNPVCLTWGVYSLTLFLTHTQNENLPSCLFEAVLFLCKMTCAEQKGSNGLIKVNDLPIGSRVSCERLWHGVRKMGKLWVFLLNVCFVSSM